MNDEKNRRRAYTEEELEIIAEKLAIKMQSTTECRLTKAQQEAVIELITQKKKAVKFFLWMVGAMFLWILKDVYLYIASHITFGWGR